MFREIKKKKLILENRKPYSREVANYIDEINLIDWIYTFMRLEGSIITKGGVEKVVKGEFLVEVPIMDHGVIDHYHNAIKYAYDLAGMGTELNERILLDFYKRVANTSDAEYRRNNPILVMLDYNPPHPSEIQEQMDLLMQWLYTDNCDSNPILKAAYLHNKLLEIYPFEEHSEAVARMAMYYELIRNGYPPVFLNFSEQEYYDAIRHYLKKEEIQPIYHALERGVYNKLEIMLQLTSE